MKVGDRDWFVDVGLLNVHKVGGWESDEVEHLSVIIWQVSIFLATKLFQIHLILDTLSIEQHFLWLNSDYITNPNFIADSKSFVIWHLCSQYRFNRVF